MTEDPRGRGYPNLAKPETRVAQAARHFWQTALMAGPTKAHRALALVNNSRLTIARKRR